MISWTRVSKNGRRAGMSKPRHVGHGQPHDDRGDKAGVVADDVAGGRHGDHAGELGGGAEHLAEPERPQQRTTGARCRRRRRPRRCPTAEQELRRAGSRAPRGCSWQTAWNTTAPRMPPTGSISEPSQVRTRWSRSVGRMKRSSGPTTVGPETTRIAPIMSAAPR